MTHDKPFQQELATIAARASSLRERLAGAVQVERSPASRAVAERRWARWAEVAAEGDVGELERRLEWIGLDAEGVKAALGIVLPIGDVDALPEWAVTFAACQDDVQRWARRRRAGEAPWPRFLRPQEPLPFEELIVPYVEHASFLVRERVRGHLHLFTDDAFAVLEHQLLAELADLAAPALESEFSGRRAASHARLARMLGAHGEEYRHFIGGLLDAGLSPLFTRYPVLARLFGVALGDWIRATEALARRLAGDWESIATTFFPDVRARLVTGIEANLSDRHGGGQTVSILSFDNGVRVVYKPRAIELCVAFYELLAWCNARGLALPFKILRTLPRDGYGWEEFVLEQACPDRAGVARFYERAGMVLCTAYALEAMDLHFQNVIACGEHLVIVDTETMFSPRIRARASGNARTDAMTKGFRQLDESVLRTGLLPRWQLREPGKSYDSAGLWDNGGQALPFQVPVWRSTNTDDMTMEYRSTRTEPRANVPSVGGQKLPITGFIKEITRGFDGMYRFLMQHRDTLCAADGPLARFAELESRFLFRPTQVYYYVLTRSLKLQWLADGAERSIEIDVLSRGILHSKQARSFARILEHEREAIERLDVPLFSARTRHEALHIGAESTGASFEAPSYERVRARLAGLSEPDRHRQAMILVSSLSTRDWGRAETFAGVSTAPVPEDGRFRPDLFVAAASEIAATLQGAAILGDDGSATWLSPQYIPAADQYQLLPMRESLYDGNVGVALFLAALHALRPSAAVRDLAFRALDLLRSRLHDPDRVGLIVAGGIGGAQGIGSIVYSLVRCSRLLDAPHLVAVADQAAQLIDGRAIAMDESLDVLFGCAGAILGLLARHEQEPAPWVLDKALACGEHLLARRTGEVGERSWVTSEGKRLTGFSHGAAGIAYALLRLARASGERRFCEAAEEAIAYEDGLFLTEEGNWPDLRSVNAERMGSMCTWCHGACGIGLVRVGGLSSLDTEPVRRDIEVALAKTLAQPFSEIDHLCCGNLGRAEFLLAAGRVMGRAQLVAAARGLAQRVVARAGLAGDYANVSYLTANLGFFQGTAGIGYELLRMTDPELLPSVLLWE